jgi:hypothetical protein
MQRDEFALQIDALVSNAGGCAFCDEFGDDWSARGVAFAAAFLYWFKETATGWRPFAGGGLVFTRLTYSFDDQFGICGEIVVCDTSATGFGPQIQGGIARGNWQFDGRVQGTIGGAFLAGATYRIGNPR